MPLKFRNIRLPFLRISSSRKGSRSFVWHVGPWSYSTSTGQQSVKLSKKVKYVSKTRSQRATAAKAKAEKRATERAYWDQKIAEDKGVQSVDSVVPTRGIGLAADQEAYNLLPFAERQEKVRSAGMCGARTQDGSACLRTGHCPHHSRAGRS